MSRSAEWHAPDFPVVTAISDLRFNVIVQDDLLYLVALENVAEFVQRILVSVVPHVVIERQRFDRSQVTTNSI